MGCYYDISTCPGTTESITGKSAKALSERFGKIMQDRQSLTINSNDTSINKSKQLDYAIPQATIASLSAGEVVGIVADNPDQRIPQKMIHAEIQHNSKLLNGKNLLIKIHQNLKRIQLKSVKPICESNAK